MSDQPAEDGKFERPPLPGAPYVAQHPMHRKVAYASVGLTLALFGNFGNALVATNLPDVAGAYGVTAATGTWLVTMYVGVGTCSNMFMIVGREQFGYDRMIIGALLAYAVAAWGGLLFPSFGMALLGRAMNGLATSTGVAVGIYYLLQVLPKPKRPAAIVLIIGCVQVATPLGRYLPVELLTTDANHGLHLIVLALTLAELAIVLTWRLPPPFRINTLQWLDLATVSFALPASLLIAAVVTMGREYWWTDTPWLGWMLAGGIALSACAAAIEIVRRRPIVKFDLLTQGSIVRFVLIALLERVVASQQSSAVTGLASLANLNNDQLHGLFAAIAVAMVGGIGTAVFTLGKKAIPIQMVAALLLISVGSWIDSGSNAQTRPVDLILSQAMVGFGLTLFVGPALLYSVGQVLKVGPEIYVTMILLFSMTQYLGSAIGSALLGSAQYIFEQVALVALSSQLVPAGVPLTPEQLQHLAMARQDQAAVIGYLDTFELVSILAAVTALIIAAAAGWQALQARRLRSGP